MTRGAADLLEPDRFVETHCGRVLLVDIDGQGAFEPSGVLDDHSPATLAQVVRVANGLAH